MRALGRSARPVELLCALGNAGIAADARRDRYRGLDDLDGLVGLAADEAVDLDALRSVNLAITFWNIR